MNRLLKILVIFFVSLILTILIYNMYYVDEINILSISDSLVLSTSPFNSINNNYNNYLKENYKLTDININKLKYDDIYQKIYYDNSIYYKGKYINIKNVISRNDYIIINANTKISLNKCKMNERIYKEYLNNTFEKMTKISDLILQTGNKKIIFLTPYCKNTSNEINDYINKYFNYKSIIFINLNEVLNEKEYYLPSNNKLYPSLEGHNKIANEIIKYIN